MSKPTIYFSGMLKDRYPELFTDIVDRFSRHRQPYGILEHTNDIWCRDYMPVYGAGGIPIQFQYQPSYLEKYPDDKTDPRKVVRPLPVVTVASELKLDGGNVILQNGVAIVSERVFDENKQWSRHDVEKELIEKLELERVIFIEAEKVQDDLTGHVDGMCRFSDGGKVLLNDFLNVPLGKRVRKQLEQAGFEVTPLQVNPDFYANDRDWLPAINFLETDDVLYLPVTDANSSFEEEIVQQMEHIFPGRIIEPIDVSAIIQVRYNGRVEDGGALNCVSWEMKA